MREGAAGAGGGGGGGGAVAGKTTVYGGVGRVSGRDRRGACRTAAGGDVAGCVRLSRCRTPRLCDVVCGRGTLWR